MGAAGARHEAAGAGPESEAGPAAKEEANDASEWEDWSVGDWIAGTGVDSGGEAEAGPGAEPELEAAADEPWWVVVDNSTMEGVGRTVELDTALQAFAATVEVGGAVGGGQLTMQLGDLGGQKG